MTFNTHYTLRLLAYELATTSSPLRSARPNKRDDQDKIKLLFIRFPFSCLLSNSLLIFFLLECGYFCILEQVRDNAVFFYTKLCKALRPLMFYFNFLLPNLFKNLDYSVSFFYLYLPYDIRIADFACSSDSPKAINT